MKENKEWEKKILENFQWNVAMFEFGKRYTKKENDSWFHSITLKKIAIFLIVAILLTGVGVSAKRVIEEYQNREIRTTISIADAIQNGYAENINMEYIYSDGVGLKLSSLFMSDNNMGITLDFKINHSMELDGNTLEYDYIVYNEKGEIYANYTNYESDDSDMIEEYRKEMHTQEDLNGYWLSIEKQCITSTKDNIEIATMITPKDTFPKAKKLFLMVKGIYSTEWDGENFKTKKLTNSNWKIEINVPDKFYNETVIEYALVEKTPEIEIQKAIVIETSMTFIATIQSINEYIEIKVEDENGNVYEANGKSFSRVGEDKITVSTQLPINKRMSTQTLYLKMKVSGEERNYVLQQISE